MNHSSFESLFFEEYVESLLYFYIFLGTYFFKGLKSSEDVCKWLRSLGDEYATYEHPFRKHNIDGYWLLNHVDDTKLAAYGIKNKEHRQAILDGIKELREKCPEQFAKPQ
jgi:hypothetical protein